MRRLERGTNLKGELEHFLPRQAFAISNFGRQCWAINVFHGIVEGGIIGCTVFVKLNDVPIRQFPQRFDFATKTLHETIFTRHRRR